MCPSTVLGLSPSVVRRSRLTPRRHLSHAVKTWCIVRGSQARVTPWFLLTPQKMGVGVTNSQLGKDNLTLSGTYDVAFRLLSEGSVPWHAFESRGNWKLMMLYVVSCENAHWLSCIRCGRQAIFVQRTIMQEGGRVESLSHTSNRQRLIDWYAFSVSPHWLYHVKAASGLHLPSVQWVKPLKDCLNARIA